MDCLDRYLLKEFFLYCLLILLGLGVLFIGIDFLANFWGSPLGFWKTVQVYLYKFPWALQQFVPVACLMATLLVLTSMSKQNEVLALFAGGVSSLRVISTFLAAVATTSTVSFLMFDNLVPIFQKKQILLNKGLKDSEENWMDFDRDGFWYRNGNIIYKVGQFDPENSSLKQIQVYLFSSQFQLLERIQAKDAVFNTDKQVWVLRDGFAVAYPLDTKFPEVLPFTTKEGIIPEKPKDFKTLKTQEETMRLKDLRRYIERNASYGLDTTVQRVRYHERIATVFTPLIFLLIAFPLAMTPLKNHSIPKSVGLCFLIVFIYVILFHMSLSVGKGGHIPALVAAWFPNVLFFSFGLFRMGRV